VPALAAADCPSGPTTEAFAGLGDESAYTPVPGGSFEEGAPGWTLQGASIVEGNESFDVAGGSSSLEIAAGGEAVSPQICVSSSYPTFRFFDRAADQAAGPLIVSVRWPRSHGAEREKVVGVLDPASGWQASPALQLASALPLWMPGSTIMANLVFRPARDSGAWGIDDVYVDPYSR
jgi:hypothetical protein